jgi:hypothetical protein
MNLLKLFRDKSFTDKLPVTLKLPVMVEEPVIKEEPVKINVSIEENVEPPDTISEPLITAPLDAVTDEKWASLPLTINLFQVGNSYSILTVIGFISQYI